MAGLESHQGVLHTIKAWLYPNYLQHAEGKYMARARAETPLSVENVCASATTRGGAEINYETMVEAVRLYMAEAMYQLADGFSVNNGYYSIHPSIKGGFDSTAIDPERNKPDFNFRKGRGMRELLEHTSVTIEGVAPIEAYIGEVQDVASQSGDALTPEGMFIIEGSRIKIDGTAEANGVYFVNKADSERTKVTGHFAENLPSRLVLQIPALAAGVYRLEILTQFSGSGTPLKASRTIGYDADLTVQ
jgi:hypothetical protein